METRISICRKISHPNRLGGNVGTEGGMSGQVLFEQHICGNKFKMVEWLRAMAEHVAGTEGLDIAGGAIYVVLRLHPDQDKPAPPNEALSKRSGQKPTRRRRARSRSASK